MWSLSGNALRNPSSELPTSLARSASWQQPLSSVEQVFLTRAVIARYVYVQIVLLIFGRGLDPSFQGVMAIEETVALYLLSQSSLSRRGMRECRPGPSLLDRTKTELQSPRIAAGSWEADVEENRIAAGEGGSVLEQAGQGPCGEDDGAGVETESRKASRDHADADWNFKRAECQCKCRKGK